MSDDPLYLSEPQIARRLIGVGGLEKWKAIAPLLERQGLPKIDALFGGRYWPAVVSWLNAFNRIDVFVPPKPIVEKWKLPPKEPRKRPENVVQLKKEPVD